MDEYNFAMLFIRVVAGLTMASHGYAKFFKGGRIPGTAGWFDSIGMKPGRFHAPLAASGEIVAGLCLVVGFLTTFACFGFVGLMGVAFWTVHRPNGFMILNEGWEYIALLAAIAVTIAMLGPLEWSIDSAIGWDDHLDGYVGLAIAACGGLLAAATLLAVFFRPDSPQS